MALLAILVVHLVWLCWFVAPGYASPDADGYFAQARLIATEGRTSIPPGSPVQYFGIHWLEQENGEFVSRYPSGLPVLLAGTWSLLGRQAAFYVNPLLATLTLLFVFLLCRSWVGEKLALAAATIYAVVPLANYHAIHSDAHTTAAFFLIAGVWVLDRWGRQGGAGLAVASGLLLGYLPTVRYAEAVAGLGVLLFLLLQWPHLSGRRRELLYLIAGAALPLGLLILHNQVHFGAFWKTGYALTNEQQITWDNLANNWRNYLEALLGSGVGTFAALGIAGMAAMSLRREARPLGLTLLTIALTISVVYAGYYFNRGPQGASIRFLLPTMPLYLLPAMWLFRQFGDRRIAAVVLGALLVVQVVRGVPGSMERMRREHDGAQRSAMAVEWLDENIPESSVVVSNRRFLEQVNFTGKWKLADSSVFLGDRRRGFGPAAMFGNDPDRPSPMQVGKAAKLRAKYEDLGPWERASLALDDAEAWAEGKETYWISSGDREIRQVERLIAGSASLQKVGSIELPAAQVSRTRRPGFGGTGPERMREMMRRRMGDGEVRGRRGRFDGQGMRGMGGPEGSENGDRRELTQPPGARRGLGGPGAGGGRFSISGTWDVYQLTR